MCAWINYGLIGVGGFGRQHLATISDFEQARRLRLTAVCDPAVHRLGAVTEDLKVRKVRLYEDIGEMLAREADLTAVTIAAPIPFHYQMVKRCLERELFVYLEKPPVPLLWQLDDLIEADRGRRVAVGFQMVESDWSQWVKRSVVEGKLGELREIRVSACWPRTGSYYARALWAGRMAVNGEPVFDGPATNALAHLIHASMFFAGEGFDGFTEPVDIRGELYRARPIESYDMACLSGNLASGVRFHSAFSHATEKELPFVLELVGSDGWVRVSEAHSMIESSWGGFPCCMDTAETVAKCYDVFLDYVSGRRGRPSTLLTDTRGYVLATNAMLYSSGGIRTIDAANVRHLENGGDDVYDVDGLHGAMADRRPLLFSERDFPWALEAPTVETDVLNGARSSLSDFFGRDYPFRPAPARATDECRESGEAPRRMTKQSDSWIGFDPTYGYDLDKLLRVGAPEAPGDFADFWQEKYEQARQVPLRIACYRVESVTPGLQIYEVEYDSLGGCRIGAWITLPADGHFERCVVNGHGYAGRKAPDATIPGPPAVVIYPCARGFDLSAQSGVPACSELHVLCGIECRETYVHLGCVADLWCAASVLAELYPSAANNLQYIGCSFGGGIGALALPWDQRFQRAYLGVPSFGNHPLRVTMVSTGSGESVRRYYQKHPEVLNVLAYFDAATAARCIQIPVFVAAARADPSVPPPGQFSVYNALAGEKELFIRQVSHPDNPAENEQVFERLDHWFNHGRIIDGERFDSNDNRPNKG